MTREECIRLITDVYKQFVPPGHVAGEVTAETRLFGGDSPLDSTALVSLLVEIEQQVSDLAGNRIVIANERAMSQTRSPFRTIGSLAEYIHKLLSEVSCQD